MQIPIDISFRGLPRWERAEAEVRARAVELERFFDRITSCRVLVEAPRLNLESSFDVVDPDEIAERRVGIDPSRMIECPACLVPAACVVIGEREIDYRVQMLGGPDGAAAVFVECFHLLELRDRRHAGPGFAFEEAQPCGPAERRPALAGGGAPRICKQ